MAYQWGIRFENLSTIWRQEASPWQNPQETFNELPCHSETFAHQVFLYFCIFAENTRQQLLPIEVAAQSEEKQCKKPN